MSRLPKSRVMAFLSVDEAKEALLCSRTVSERLMISLASFEPWPRPYSLVTSRLSTMTEPE